MTWGLTYLTSIVSVPGTNDGQMHFSLFCSFSLIKYCHYQKNNCEAILFIHCSFVQSKQRWREAMDNQYDRNGTQ